MRPASLFPLFADVARLRGVGDQVKKALARLFPARAATDSTSPRGLIVRDLVFHLPIGMIDRRAAPPLSGAVPGSIITATVRVDAHYPPLPARYGRKGARTPYKVSVSNTSGSLMLIFFHQKGDYLLRSLPMGEERVISGKVERHEGVLQMTHPDRIALIGEREAVQEIEPVYPLTYALSNRQLTSLIRRALATVTAQPEWIEAALLRQQGWQGWKESLLAAHRPAGEDDLSALAPSRARLAYDELLANQLALALVRKRLKKEASAVLQPKNTLRAQVRNALPYRLTAGQEQVLGEIDADMASGSRMLRLLQGDVGSGKTVVALMAMLNAVENGFQCALMVPTEIVAQQHLAFIQGVCERVGIRAELLTGSVKGKKRDAVLEGIASGEIHLVIGTQALFQEQVAFKALGLIVIDEQHRFGVNQRLALSAKGVNPHILLMTATPIPRSLSMTAFGDMDSSLLKEKPVGRKPIDTRTIPLSRAEEVIERLPNALASGSKIYWICPLVEEAEMKIGEEFNPKTDLAAAEARYGEFKHRFGGRAGLVHGRMRGAEREKAMKEFAEGGCDILVATTVVEVGVNVPQATIIVIEHAERFGLSQLHQLRGRVGRSDTPSTCLLLYNDRIGEIAKARLKTIRETEDGFRIAEQDLMLRGSGDVLGTRQSGLPEFHVADLAVHGELLSIAQSDAKMILHADPTLKTARGEALRTLLYLFEYDANIRYLGSG